MPKENLIKTKYPNIYKSKSNKFYLRKMIKGKMYVRLVGENLTEKQAELKSKILLKNILDKPTDSLKKTLIEYINEYIQLNKKLFSDYWEKRTTYELNKLEILHNRDIDSLKTEDVQRVINVLLDTYSPSYVEDVKSSLSALCNYYKIENIARDIRIPKYDNQVQFSLEEDKVKLLMDSIREYPCLKLRCFFMLGVHGRRKGEISNLLWENVDLENCVIHIDYKNSKNRRNMTYPILPELRDNLYQLYMIDYPEKEDYVFVTKNNTPLYYISKRWNKLVKSLDIKMRFHDLRHLIGYIAINKGISLEQIGKTLGHSNLSTTRRYSKLKEETAKIVLKEIYGN